MPNRAAFWRAKVEAEAGAACPVVGRDRRGLTFRLPNGRFRLIRSIGEMHTLDGREIDTDLEPGQGAFHSQTKAGRLDFAARFRPSGGRLLTPRADHPSETVELGACERWTGRVWVPMPPVPPVRSGHQLSFDHSPLARIRISVKASFVACEIIVGNVKQNSGWRWPVTLTGLTWERRQVVVNWPAVVAAENADLFPLVELPPPIFDWRETLVSQADGEIVMVVSAPKWTDSSPMPKSSPVGWSYAAGFLVHDAAVLPADVVFPVVVR